MDAPAGRVRDFVCRVLNEFEKLAVAVSALCDTAFSVGVFSYQAGVHGIGLKDATGLFEDGFDHRGGRGRHDCCTPDVKGG
ncbi:hypothetical protein [Streptomyces sp. SID10815]|uniref:hypothetical protein n=1 Tax=Streptomyces sp. SID10815 TaxID=2706027 RepID=UPI001EF34C30|nr:hypothetical protein [Streptomyces sp. SID10815]